MLLSIQWVLGAKRGIFLVIKYSVGSRCYSITDNICSLDRAVYSMLLSIQWVLGVKELYIPCY